MQHQYWVTKRTVLKRLGTKEDDCIVSSDAELDAKLELFRSISDSCILLQRVVDQYQERLCVLSQEENALGRFLQDAGKSSGPVPPSPYKVTNNYWADKSIHQINLSNRSTMQTHVLYNYYADVKCNMQEHDQISNISREAGKYMITAGKAIAYSGQQRLMMRSPLLRLYHEVETFRGRAVSDMRGTVTCMEKSRSEYRAALSWMKAASAQLDPDTEHGIHKFRKAQGQVRDSKRMFDKLTLDVLQKIDLLSAARCNMFSHVLATYQNSFVSFAEKVAQTLAITTKAMMGTPQFGFCVLKELAQNVGEQDGIDKQTEEIDKDQLLLFKEEYKDDSNEQKLKTENHSTSKTQDENSMQNVDLFASTMDLFDSINNVSNYNADSSLNSDLSGIDLSNDNFFAYLPSQLLIQSYNTLNANTPKENVLDMHESENNEPANQNSSEIKPKKSPATKKEIEGKDMRAWFELFADLDPLANPDAIPGSSANQSHAA